jgi:murein DD-endopeptidase MepM/ murein hydrolase activator NlpD
MNLVRVNNSDKKKSSALKKPSEFKQAKPEVISFHNNDIKAVIYSKQFAQGNGVYAEIEKQGGVPEPEKLTLSYKNISVPVTKTSWGFRAMWGIDPEEKPGYVPVVITYSVNGKDLTLATEIKIKDVDYPVSKSMLNVGKFSDKNYTSDPKFKDLIAECSALRTKAFSSVSPDSIQSSLSHPRDMHKITGDYWRKRIYLSYEKKKKKKVIVEGKKSFHRGIDLKGDIGAPVFAMADGVVVLSHSMFYEGKMVVVDHGNQVFSYYQHMNYLKVKEGDKVRAGDYIGEVGATGMVTGPHLHVAFSIRGVHVDPLSILSLPVSR